MKPIALALFLVAAFPAAAQMHKCVDERGRVHYTDKPGPGCKPAAAALQPAAPPAAKSAPGPAAKSAAARGASPLVPPGQKRATKARPAAKVAAASAADDRAQLAARCKTLREEHAWLMSPRGSGVEAHAARVGQVERALRACP